jgi:hypothetical protein
MIAAFEDLDRGRFWPNRRLARVAAPPVAMDKRRARLWWGWVGSR